MYLKKRWGQKCVPIWTLWSKAVAPSQSIFWHTATDIRLSRRTTSADAYIACSVHGKRRPNNKGGPARLLSMREFLIFNHLNGLV